MAKSGRSQRVETPTKWAEFLLSDQVKPGASHPGVKRRRKYPKLFPILSVHVGPCVRVEVVCPRFVARCDSRPAAKQDYALRLLIICHDVSPTPAGMYDRVHFRPCVRVEVISPCLGSPGAAEQDPPV